VSHKSDRLLGSSFAEMARILRFWDEGRVEVAGAARLLAARRDGPVLVAGLHLGNPEVLGLTLARLGLRSTLHMSSRGRHDKPLRRLDSYLRSRLPRQLATDAQSAKKSAAAGRRRRSLGPSR
jgi:lauroyl/myristoyl acyltransferase